MKNVFQRRKVCRKCQVVFFETRTPHRMGEIQYEYSLTVSQEEESTRTVRPYVFIDYIQSRVDSLTVRNIPARWISVRQGRGETNRRQRTAGRASSSGTHVAASSILLCKGPAGAAAP